MPAAMPIDLLLASLLMTSLMYEMWRALRHNVFNGTWRVMVESVITLSLLVAKIFSIYFFIKYWMVTTWYWPVLLFVIKLFILSSLSILIGLFLRPSVIALIAVVCWPACAYWVYGVLERMATN